MRRLKIMVMIIAAIMLTAEIIPVYAGDTSDVLYSKKSNGEICKDIGVLKGDNGDFQKYLAKPTQRIQAAVIFLRLIGREDEALAFEGTENFYDASKIGDSNGVKIMAFLKANPEIGWAGDGKNFNPTQEVNAQQLYKVFLTILGYEQGVDFEYDNVLIFAKSKGMSEIAKNTKITNTDLATAIIEALKSTMKGGGPEDTLFKRLVGAGVIVIPSIPSSSPDDTGPLQC